jgi:polysaccharide biosynthesis protein PslH
MTASSPGSGSPLLQEHGSAVQVLTPAIRKRQVLMISTSLPFPPTNGYKMRVWALLNCLLAEGCWTDLVCFGDPADVDRYRNDLSRLCRHIVAIPHRNAGLSAGVNLGRRLAALFSRYPYAVATSRSARMQAQIETLLDAGSYDLILLEETNLLANLPSKLAVPLVVDHHNAEHLLLERYVAHAENWPKALYAWVEARKLRFWERRATRRAKAVLVCSEHDRSIFRNLASNTCVIVAPNVIDADAYTPTYDEGEENCTVLYAGGMDWYPNRDAVRYFVQRILPRLRTLVPAVEFVVAGRAPSADFKKEFSNIPGMRFTGTLPDLQLAIAKAAVCVVPLRIGSGTRLKILEAAAMGKAIVSTCIGAEGLEFSHQREIILADTPDEFAEAVAALVKNVGYRRELGCAARVVVEKRYAYAAMLTSVKDLLARI